MAIKIDDNTLTLKIVLKKWTVFEKSVLLH